VEFKKGVRGIEDEIDNPQYEPPKQEASSPAETKSENRDSGETST
jgi:hypothetical protein